MEHSIREITILIKYGKWIENRSTGSSCNKMYKLNKSVYNIVNACVIDTKLYTELQINCEKLEKNWAINICKPGN